VLRGGIMEINFPCASSAQIAPRYAGWGLLRLHNSQVVTSALLVT
jgi:hypothetical protein